MREIAYQALRLPRKTKKAFLKFINKRSLTKREMRRIGIGGNRNLADLGPRCQGFVNRCLDEAQKVGTWDYRLFD